MPGGVASVLREIVSPVTSCRLGYIRHYCVALGPAPQRSEEDAFVASDAPRRDNP